MFQSFPCGCEQCSLKLLNTSKSHLHNITSTLSLSRVRQTTITKANETAEKKRKEKVSDYDRWGFDIIRRINKKRIDCFEEKEKKKNLISCDS
jgi:hypothetical protein